MVNIKPSKSYQLKPMSVELVPDLELDSGIKPVTDVLYLRVLQYAYFTLSNGYVVML